MARRFPSAARPHRRALSPGRTRPLGGTFVHGCVVLLSGLLLFGCTHGDAPPEDPDLGVQVQWLTGDPSALLPDDLELLRLIRFVGDDPSFEETRISVGGLSETEDGRRFASPEFLSGLPTGEPLRLTVEGTTEEGTFKYLGHAGPMVLGPGERRYVNLRMYELETALPIPHEDVTGRLLHSATPLPDGRVLIAGGFVDPLAVTCPEDAPAESRCFEMEATRSAAVFDPTSGTVHPLPLPMLQARGGHSATALPDGRVLLAGGAESLTLVLFPLGDPAAPSGFAPQFRPSTGGERGGLANFELFLPEANPEAEDAERDGDPTRGGFAGGADTPGVPGRMNQPRFLHGHTPVPGSPGRVMLVGGQGGGAGSWEIFDADKPGGFGFYDNTGNELPVPRRTPAAVALSVPSPGRIWIFGGNIATNNDGLADIWSPDPTGADPNGTVQPAAADTPFPNPAEEDTPRPGFSLVSPTATAVADGTHAVVVGWLGPRCMPGTNTPTFPASADGGGTTWCDQGGASESRSFVVDGTTGLTRPQPLRGKHAFGDVAELEDGRRVFTGGLASIIWTRQPAIDVLTGAVSGGTATTGGVPYMMRNARVFHTSTELPDGGVFSIGGINLATDVRTISPLTSAEVLYLGRAPLELPDGD